MYFDAHLPPFTFSQYAQRAVMKSLRYIKLRTLSKNPTDIIKRKVHNPLKCDVPVELSHSFTLKTLQDFRVPFSFKQTDRRPSVASVLYCAFSDIYPQDFL